MNRLGSNLSWINCAGRNAPRLIPWSSLLQSTTPQRIVKHEKEILQTASTGTERWLTSASRTFSVGATHQSATTPGNTPCCPYCKPRSLSSKARLHPKHEHRRQHPRARYPHHHAPSWSVARSDATRTSPCRGSGKPMTVGTMAYAIWPR